MMSNKPPFSIGDRVMLLPTKCNPLKHLELKEARIVAIHEATSYNQELIDLIFDCEPTEVWVVRPEWLLRMGAPVRNIIHRERIMDMDVKGPYDPKLLQPADIAYARGVSWIKRNLREWPFNHELMCEATEEELIFWFQNMGDL